MLRGIRLAEQRSQRKVDSLARTLHTVPPDDLLDKVVINLYLDPLDRKSVV